MYFLKSNFHEMTCKRLILSVNVHQCTFTWLRHRQGQWSRKFHDIICTVAEQRSKYIALQLGLINIHGEKSEFKILKKSKFHPINSGRMSSVLRQ